MWKFVYVALSLSLWVYNSHHKKFAHSLHVCNITGLLKAKLISRFGTKSNSMDERTNFTNISTDILISKWTHIRKDKNKARRIIPIADNDGFLSVDMMCYCQTWWFSHPNTKQNQKQKKINRKNTFTTVNSALISMAQREKL